MMTHTKLKQVILDYILDTYNCKYVGELKIEDLNPTGYKVSFYLNHTENPLVIISDLPDKEFIDFIKNELKIRKLHRTKYCKAIKLPSDEKIGTYRQN